MWPVVLFLAFIVLFGLAMPAMLDSIGAALTGIFFLVGWFATIGVALGIDEQGFSLSAIRSGVVDGMRFLGHWSAIMATMFALSFALFLIALVFA
jgi:hypothetical protein